MPELADRRLSSFFARASAEQDRAEAEHGAVARDLIVAERRVALRVAGAALASALLPALSHRLVEDRGRPNATIAVCQAEPAYPWDHGDIGAGGLVDGSDPGGILAVHETGSGVVTLFDAGRQALLYRAARGLPWWERAAPMRIALYWALGGEGRHLLHAGAVGDERGAVLLAGSTGSGKTTVAVAAAEHGFGYLGDDHVVLDTTASPARVHAVYNTASVRTTAEQPEKTVVDMTGRGGQSWPVRAIVVPRIGGGRTRVRPLGGAKALLALAPTTVLQMPFDDGAAFASLASLARGVPCLAMDVGKDTRAVARAVELALDRA
jgi:hypothetical protein